MREWSNRIQGAKLAEIDRQELAVTAAYIGAIVSREKKPQKVEKYFNAKNARQQIIAGSQTTKKKPDFTLYNKAIEGIKQFDWAKYYSPGQTED